MPLKEDIKRNAVTRRQFGEIIKLGKMASKGGGWVNSLPPVFGRFSLLDVGRDVAKESMKQFLTSSDYHRLLTTKTSQVPIVQASPYCRLPAIYGGGPENRSFEFQASFFVLWE